MHPGPRKLTHRQLEVLELVAKGLTNREIGDVLGIALGTTKIHVSAVIEALGVTNRTEAAALLSRLQLGINLDEGEGDEGISGFGARPALALLPFERLGDDPEGDAYLARGIQTDLTRRVSGVRWFPVIQRDSTRGIDVNSALADVGRELGARYVVDGTLSREGRRFCLIVRMADSATGQPVWGEKFEGPLDGLQDTQQVISEEIAASLEPAVLRLEQLRCQREQAEQLSVWDLCKRAEFRIDVETPESHADSAALFERAIEIDPHSPRAWAGLALARSSSLYLGFASDLQAASAEALEAARQAVDLAPDDAEAQLSLGRALALSLQDEKAVPHLEASLEGNPSSSMTHNTLAGALRRQGLVDAAIPHYELSVRLSPRSSAVYHALGGLSLSHFSAERYEQALDYAEQAVMRDHEGSPHKGLDFSLLIPASLALLDRVEEARDAFTRIYATGRRRQLRHSARFTGKGLERLPEALRRAGWTGEF